ncbi:hypothetical protein SOVF_098470 [Spinacia oleracea]|nr:hypothetical protein SOVF_098470 [Spinacia oleracea]
MLSLCHPMLVEPVLFTPPTRCYRAKTIYECESFIRDGVEARMISHWTC